MQKRIIVTGGLGFLGTALVTRLSLEGHHVVVIDPGNLELGTFARTGLRPKHIRVLSQDIMSSNPVGSWACLRPGNVEVHHVLAENFETETVGWQDFRPDEIYHLGADASPVAYKKHPILALHAGSLATHAMVQLAMFHGSRLLLASTSEVYGDPLVHPQTEDYNGNVSPVGSRSMYDEAKRYAEAYVTAAAHQGLDARIARIFNTYGPTMKLNDGRMIPAFVQALQDGRPLPVHQPGSQTRSLCYIDDTLEGLVRLMASSEAGVSPVNIGNPAEFTVLDIAVMVHECWDELFGDLPASRPSRVEVEVDGQRVDAVLPAARPAQVERIRLIEQPCTSDPTRRCPDITRARVVLGWTPTVGIMEGIRRTLRGLCGTQELSSSQ